MFHLKLGEIIKQTISSVYDSDQGNVIFGM